MAGDTTNPVAEDAVVDAPPTALPNRWARLWRHVWLDGFAVRRRLPEAAVDRLEARVREGERGHGGEIRLCIEAAFPFSLVWRGVTPRQRAVSLFGQLGVWDTERNNGVLIYLLLADRSIEIVADRGLSRSVSDAEWRRVMRPLKEALRAGDFEGGLVRAVDEVAALLKDRFAHAEGDEAHDVDELPDRPVVL